MNFNKNIKLLIWVISLTICSVYIPKHANVDDSLLYNLATDFFINGANPYATDNWIKYWEAWGTLDRPMVWNPPFFYVLYLPLYYLYQINNLLPTAVSIMFLSCAVLKFWQLCCSKPIPDYAPGVFIYFSAPILFALQVNQISLILLSFYILIIYFYFNGKYISAGILVPILLVKPHIYILSFPALCLASIIQRKYSFVLTAILSLFFLSLTAEILNPGINGFWLLRETWPISFIGNSMTGLFRHMGIAIWGIDRSWISILLIVLAYVFLLFKSFSKGSIWIYVNFPVLILTDPVVSPYGFISDHVTAIIPFIVLLGFALEKGIKWLEACVVLSYVSILMAVVVSADYIQIENYPALIVYMFVPMMLGLLTWAIVAKIVSFRNIYFLPR